MSVGELASFAIQSFSLVLPILIAGLVLILVLRKNLLPKLDEPIDFGAKIQGKRIFGDNKTWRGIIIYIGMSIAACIVLWSVSHRFSNLINVVFSLNPLYIGSAIALSYILGELINSFVKRRLNIDPGALSGARAQLLLDHVDGMITVSLVLVFGFGVQPVSIVVAVVMGILLHSLTNGLMKRYGLK
jgi:hypothetical protein